ncbi:MAG: integrase [Microvirga sp.]|jgi:integrase|nr:integrase [Microvirga sp.]
MARAVNRLSARGVEALSKPGRHADGAGLYLVVDRSGAKRWVFLFRWQGRLKEMGLGSTRAVSLSKAREAAAKAREMVAAGRNPIEARRAASTKVPTFAEMAETLIESISHGLRNAKHIAQWRMTLSVERDKTTGELLEAGYCLKLRSRAVSDIETSHVLETLQPIWTTKPETASRVRGRIERVLDAAKAKGFRTGENPARWRGHLDTLLSRRKRLQRGHHDALPYTDVPAFIADLRQREAIAALMLEFTILCVSRTGEVTGARWPEVNMETKVWTVPAARMKAGKEHRVPLGPRALEILSMLEAFRTTGDYIFPGMKKGRPLSNMAMLMLMQKRMERPDITVHGFRSSFRDWAGECTSFPREVAEAALAHTVGDEVERAYRRGDALEKRRKLMLAWEGFVGSAVKGAGSNVIAPARWKAK